ncbi:hypothetical protein FQA39_LY02695 [Lamprigera yunnana]|nr:hypothetical protein FQA39_LY02695 [Lamprigera yunnana]
MTTAVFPAAKLGALLLRQISKPLANYIKEHAKKSPVLRTYICMPPAQFYHWCEVKTKMWVLNLGRPISVPPLSEAMAIELGANLLGEAIMFTVAALLLIREYNRSSRKEMIKEEKRQEEVNNLNMQVRELFFQVQQQNTQIRELLREVYQLDGKKTSKKNHNKNSKTPPPPPEDTLPTPQEQVSTPSVPEKTTPLHSPSNNIGDSNLLLKAISSLENEFLYSYNEREQGLLTMAINYLYKDVYKIPLSMY